MSIYSNGSAFQLPLPEHAPALTAPMVRPVSGLSPKGGRLFTATHGEYGYRSIGLRITARGHWYRTDDEPDGFHNDTLCRGCGHHGHFDYILDYRRCPRPASQQDIAFALLGRSAVSA